MKKKQKEVLKDEHELEIIKAVAQAWYGHSTSPSTSSSTSEFDAPRMNFKSRPSRFKLEANKSLSRKHTHSGDASWDFGQSLWDSYEIVSVSKKLDAALVLDHHCFDLDKSGEGEKKRKPKESPNSLASLIGRVSSRRFRGDDIPH